MLLSLSEASSPAPNLGLSVKFAQLYSSNGLLGHSWRAPDIMEFGRKVASYKAHGSV
jgi:hypothetical protein